MEKNDMVEIEITGMTDDGSGVGRADGIAVFVPYTIIGERIRALILKVNKTYAFGKLTDIIKPSEHRIKSMCPHFYKCGGCQLMHMDYQSELEYKKQKVEDCLKRIGGIATPVSDIVPSEDRFRYRNKVQLPVGEDGIGFYRKNSHDIIDIDDCLLQNKIVKEICFTIRKWIKDYDINVYSENSGIDGVRHIYIRESNDGFLLVIVSSKKTLHIDKLVEMTKKHKLPVVGIIENLNPNKTNVVLGKKYETIWGSDTLCDSLGDVSFKISPSSFYQVNKKQTVKLYTVASELADLKGNEIVYDVYCGIGTIGQFMARSSKKIVGIEIVPDAVKNAVENAENNGLKNAVYYCGAAEKLAPRIIDKEGRPDIVILDPPRKGCEETLLKCVANSKPKKIVYISCKPSTLARDLKFLESLGYKTEKVVPVDMFPCTSHVETVCLLENTRYRTK